MGTSVSPWPKMPHKGAAPEYLLGMGHAELTALATDRQGLTLVHYSAQLEPFLTQKHTLNSPDTPYHPLNTPETTPNRTPCHTEGA